MRKYWRRFLALTRLSRAAVCDESVGRDPWNDFHDYPDSTTPEPMHFHVRSLREGILHMSDRRPPILCLDFDGVLHSYTSGWQGADVVSDPPTEGAMPWLKQAVRHWRVCIYSSRSHQRNGILAMQFWLKMALARYCEDAREVAEVYNAIEWPDHKPSALVTIDDRALTFTGDWSDFDPAKLRDFKPWNKP